MAITLQRLKATILLRRVSVKLNREIWRGDMRPFDSHPHVLFLISHSEGYTLPSEPQTGPSLDRDLLEQLLGHLSSSAGSLEQEP